MTAVFERLQKVLNLERRQGYRNRAVIGGMARFAERWEEDALGTVADARQAALVKEIVFLLNSYSAAEDRPGRQRLVEDILGKAEQAASPVAEAAPAAEQRAALPPPQPAQPPAKESEPPRAPRQPARRPAAPPPSQPEATGLDAPVTRLPNVGPRNSQKLERLGARTVGDLLYLFPRRYDDYSLLKTIDRLQYGEEVTIIGNVWDIQSRQGHRRNITIVNAVVGDATGTIQVTWFNPYITRLLRPGRTVVLSGKVDERLGRLVMVSPAWEPLDKDLIHTGRLVPVYPLTEGISARWLRRLMKQAVDAWAKRLRDYLPEAVREHAGLLALGKAIEQIHFPDSQELLEVARRRLAFDEFFLIQMGALRLRHAWRSQPGRALEVEAAHLGAYRAALPFHLTAAQERTLSDIAADLAQPQPMNRLLQGDVGSGKTAVAAAAMWIAVGNGAQAAIMAPTEILAEQHYLSLSALFENLQHPQRQEPLRLALLIGSLKPQEKEATQAAIAAGEVDIAIGTHALIQEVVSFHDLAFVVIDEQHRFGVQQRAALRQKGYHPHVLVMSATPIPRSLALTVYGDLDLSTIDELPPGRQPIKTRWIRPWERERAYVFLRHQVEEGRQAFIICPLVEESETLDAKAAVEEHQRLQKQVFPDLRLGLLHGRLKGEEKEAVMRAFRERELDILVSTSVVEVGIDVPNATVMLVEGAERFGLAQLHQFRGRVGRGEQPSYCLLVSQVGEGDAAERLQALVDSQDGFVLAEKDLELRGPGDFFGTRQSGLPELRMAQLSDLRTLELARAEAQKLFAEDPDLKQPAHRLLARQVARFWRGQGDLS
ncbi:MAG: ATP-dependent DNA helicase RecG [Chloroflexi bacterium]|nr:ATP-dependent DNA helicase RecG [Chloroflexota bacterium]